MEIWPIHGIGMTSRLPREREGKKSPMQEHESVLKVRRKMKGPCLPVSLHRFVGLVSSATATAQQDLERARLHTRKARGGPSLRWCFWDCEMVRRWEYVATMRSHEKRGLIIQKSLDSRATSPLPAILIRRSRRKGEPPPDKSHLGTG